MVASPDMATIVSGDAMPQRVGFLQFRFAPSPSRGFTFRRVLPLVRIVSLVLLLLLPMQMRAGGDEPHPHALLQLMLDARDGAIDHHADVAHEEPHEASESGQGWHEPVSGVREPDIPTFGGLSSASGSMALLLTIAAFCVIPMPERTWFWPAPLPWAGRFPALEPPPPRPERS